MVKAILATMFLGIALLNLLCGNWIMAAMVTY